ncbi:MAG: membrane protein insertion efficiency factor YidD [Candidatus Berkelbacteria bacterium]
MKKYNNRTIIQRILIWFINLYQNTLSLDHGWFSSRYPGGYCKYHPDCSEYCKQAIEKKGAAKGIALGAWRVLRCNPWSAGGYDPVNHES